METIQKELRKSMHYLSMKKREQAANYIDKLLDILNKYSEDEMLLTHQSTIASQAAQIEALTQAVVGRDLLIGQYIKKVKEQANLLAIEAQPPAGNTLCNPHPDAPHGFMRSASASADRYVCECEGWMPDGRPRLQAAPPDCRLCTYRQTWGESEEHDCILITPCINGSGFKPAPDIKLWSKV